MSPTLTVFSPHLVHQNQSRADAFRSASVVTLQSRKLAAKTPMRNVLLWKTTAVSDAIEKREDLAEFVRGIRSKALRKSLQCSSPQPLCFPQRDWGIGRPVATPPVLLDRSSQPTLNL